MTFVDKVPILVVFAILVSAALVALEAGHLIASRWGRINPDGKFTIESAASRTVLGLMAFLLAFSFGGAVGRYKEMRSRVQSDTSAVANAYRVSDLLPEPRREEARTLLRKYLEARIEALASQDWTRIEQTLTQSHALQQQLWDLSVAARKGPDGQHAGEFANAIGRLIESHNARLQLGLLTRIPLIIWVMLGLLLLLGAGLLGFLAGLHGTRNLTSTCAVIIAFSLVLIMVIDLDRPFRSLFASVGDPAADALLNEMKSDAN